MREREWHIVNRKRTDVMIKDNQREKGRSIMESGPLNDFLEIQLADIINEK